MVVLRRGARDTPYLGLDVGNTQLSAACVCEDGQIVAVRHHATPASADAALDALLTLASDLGDECGRPVAVGIGFGGPVDVRAGKIESSFLSSGWEGMPLGEIVAGALGVPAWLANDADAAGLGEAVFGAGREAESLLYVNVGTGVGGALILDGELHTGATSGAGEIGHMVVQPGGPECECGKRGCVQALVSGRSMARRARELLDEDGADSTLASVPASELTGRHVGEAAVAGDELAGEIVAEAALWLGLALANAVHLIDPELIVIGGGVAEIGEPFLGPVREAYRESIFGPAGGTPIRRAHLGYDAGVVGAATVAMRGAGARAEPSTNAGTDKWEDRGDDRSD